MKSYSSPPTSADAQVIAGATSYIVTCFLGRARFHKEERATVDAARETARSMAASVGRTVLIYAIMGGRQAVLETCDPPK